MARVCRRALAGLPLAALALAAGFADVAVARDVGFPAFLDTRVVDGDLARDERALFDGTLSYLYPGFVANIDDDGQPDFAFTGDDDADPGDTLYVDLSADGLDGSYSAPIGRQ